MTASPDAPITVKRLLEHLKNRVEAAYASVCVTGEVSGFRNSGRHWYFTLKEEGAALSCAVWASQQNRIGHTPRDGEQVVLKGALNVYVPGGSITLVVTRCQSAGLGDLHAKLRQLEAALRKEGLFDRPKRALPRVPKRIGVVAALGGAALRDVLEVTRRRAPGIDILIAPAAAQGERCVEENILALQEVSDPFWGCDVVLLVRGGGSLEDLWGYNDPALVRLVAQCPIPIITGVGHEIDTTLVDLAADRRAATPSQAAEFATPDLGALRDRLGRCTARLISRIQWRMNGFESTLNLLMDRGLMRCAPGEAQEKRLDRLIHRLEMAHPQRRMDQAMHRLTVLKQRLLHASRQVSRTDDLPIIHQACRRLPLAMERALDARSRRLAILEARLHGLNPAGPLERGFVLAVDKTGKPITSAHTLKTGSLLELKWKDGSKKARVE